MTSAQDVIESYVADVAGRLPLRKRGDIARELQGLLHDELQARSEAEGHTADEAMARAVVTAFGKPADIAAGYRAGGLLIIPPEQASRFLRASLIGVVIQWAIGIAAAVARVNEGVPESIVVQQWFFSWGLGAFWWPGFMVLCAAVAAWFKTRKQLQSDAETNVSSSKLNRIGAAVVLPIAIFFTVFYAAPSWFVSHLAPSMDLSWITYTDEFRSERLWALLTYMAGNVALLALFVLRGHESRTSRQFAIVMKVTGVAVMTWCALAGPAFVGSESDKLFRFILLLLAGVELFDLWRRVSREMILAR
jgi:hypothetical protein